MNYVQDVEALKSEGTPLLATNSQKICGVQLCSTIGMNKPQPPQGQIIKPESDDPEQEGLSLLFIQTANSGTFIQKDGRNILTLVEISETTVWFSDRPHRATGYELTELFVAKWAEGEDSFEVDPPNAALEILDNTGDSDVIIIELTNPVYSSESEMIQFDVIILEEASDGLSHYSKNLDATIPSTFGKSALFIDNWLDDAVDTVSDTASDAGDTISGGASDAWDATSGGASDAWDSAGNLANQSYDSLKRGMAVVNNQVNDAENELHNAENELQKAKDKAAKAAQDLADKTEEIEKQIETKTTEISNTVINEIKDIIDEITNLFDDVKKYVIMAYAYAPMVGEYSVVVASFGAEFTKDAAVEFYQNAADDEDERFEELKYIVTHLKPVAKKTGECFVDTAKTGYKFGDDASFDSAIIGNLSPDEIIKKAVDAYNSNDKELANAATCSLQVLRDVSVLKDADSTLLTQGTFIALDESGVELNDDERNSIAVSILLAVTIVHAVAGDESGSVETVAKVAAKSMGKQVLFRGGIHSLDNLKQISEDADSDVDTARGLVDSTSAEYRNAQNNYKHVQDAFYKQQQQIQCVPYFDGIHFKHC
jgi:predicted transcriptional regulator